MTTAVHAQSPTPGFGAYKHVRWGADEGAPDGINQIDQTPDGYLWLAGDALYRFDGVNFEQIDWPASAGPPHHALPMGLMVSRSGELWVGLRGYGGVAVYRDGALVDTGMPDPPRAMASLAEAPDGTIWAASAMFDGQLRHRIAGHWESVGATLQLPAGVVMGMVFSANGDLWAVLTHQDGNSGELVRLAAGARRFERLPVPLSGRPSIALDPAGALWVADTMGTRKVVDPQGHLLTASVRFPPVPGVRTATLAFDRSGGIWGATASVGVFHIADAVAAANASVHNPTPIPTPIPTPLPALFGALQGLSSDFSYSTFVDREGSIWVGTEGGIDQFRRASATQEPAIPADPIQGLAMAGASDGSVYFESQQTLFRAAVGEAPKKMLALGPGDRSLCAARAGGVWLVQAGRSLHVFADHSETSSGFPGTDIPIGCVEDRLGRLWVALLDHTLIWRDSVGWHQADGALAQRKVWDIAATPSGDLAILGTADFAILDADGLSVMTDPGPAAMLAVGRRDIFLSGAGGLVRIRNGAVARLDSQRVPWLASLRALVQTPRGDTWVIRRHEIYRVSSADLDRAFDTPDAPLVGTLFNTQDGLASVTQHGGFTGPQSVVGGDGRVWFLNRQGAAYFEPAALARNKLPPPVAIRSLASSGHAWRDPANLILPAGTRALDITYAGLSLVIPQRARFRYRLIGVDDGWMDAGARRTAAYTNLGPGLYRFQVIAANSDGVWNDTGATLRFEIPPSFVQSWPFKLIGAAVVCALLWLAHSARMRFVAGRIRLRMAERYAERERIARDLHDTLLQSVQSLSLRFQLAVDELAPTQAARPALLQALDVADRVIAEGRDRVHDLRDRETSETGDIGEILRRLIAMQQFDACVMVNVSTGGVPRPLDPLALDEITCIAREAIFNVWRHARATCLSVEINHGACFGLRLADDGIGIAPEVAEKGREGHFGLSGMHERACKLHASLIIRPLPDRGTELVLTIPARIAYKTRRRSLFARFWRSP